MSSTTLLTTIATMAALAAGGTVVDGAGPARAASALRATQRMERVSVKAVANDQFVAVQSDGTLAPWSNAVGIAEQFDLFELGHGLIALRAVATGKFVTARRGNLLAATADAAGVDATFARVGGRGAYGRLRAVDARTFVCAQGGGLRAMAAVSRCPYAWQLLDIQPLHVGELAIVAPAPGAALLSTTATFQWAGEGDDFSLTIGSAVGASDIYASGSLGQTTQHTVPRLPLNGSTLYVRLHRRVGGATDVVDAQYTAPIRKGLLVITDFANRRLEDWTGEGNTEEDVSVQLRAMEAHWAWLSRGLERIQWDIIRVTLTQPCVADAFSDWVAFRTTVAGLVRQQVAEADYDVNGDSTIDAAWLIVSSGGDVPATGCATEIGPWAFGGASVQGGVNMFVDGQNSVSVVAGATGNFNHEFGHLLGLVDMYGDYDTVHGLTVMSYSWPVPPHDFTAYERIKLGWLKPTVVSTTTPGVWLPSAHDALAAVMVPTARPYEYFLIEYRRRPDDGYGSQNPPFNGLAVYHVLEGSSMSQNPPLLKLEPADGSITAGAPLDPADFVYPENPALLSGPMVLRSYAGAAAEVFRIENVLWRDGGLAFDVVVANATEPANLLVNGSFENGAGAAPDGWSTGSWVSGGAFAWASGTASSGDRSVSLEAPSPNDMWWSQTVTTLVPGETYMLCGSLKGENIGPGAAGANVSVLGRWVASSSLYGTFDWTRSCVSFVADAPTAEIACRLGFWGGTVSGRLWCDDVTLERLHRPF